MLLRYTLIIQDETNHQQHHNLDYDGDLFCQILVHRISVYVCRFPIFEGAFEDSLNFVECRVKMVEDEGTHASVIYIAHGRCEVHSAWVCLKEQ